MTEKQQHPLCCETCGIHKKVCSDLPHYYGKNSGNPTSGCILYDMMDKESDYADAYWNAIGLVGCASHTNAITLTPALLTHYQQRSQDTGKTVQQLVLADLTALMKKRVVREERRVFKEIEYERL